VLGDPEKRRRYDHDRTRSRRRLMRAPVGQPEATRRYASRSEMDDFASLLRSLFGTTLWEEPSIKSSHGRPDLDVETELPLSPEEAHHGRTIQLSLSFSQQCPECRGRGTTTGQPCGTCGGAGMVRQGPRPLSVHVPPGVWTGTVIRVPGQGRFSADLGIYGDLRLSIRVRPCW
jgi:DnaJ-class molecular chaperone